MYYTDFYTIYKEADKCYILYDFQKIAFNLKSLYKEGTMETIYDEQKLSEITDAIYEIATATTVDGYIDRLRFHHHKGSLIETMIRIDEDTLRNVVWTNEALRIMVAYVTVVNNPECFKE